MHLLKHIIAIMLVFSVGTNIALLTNMPDNDITILDIAQNSHFIGCARLSLNFPVCKELSKQYRKEFKEKVGLKDRGE